MLVVLFCQNIAFKENNMEIIVSSELVSEGALKMSSELKKIFDEAKKDQGSKLFASFGAIGAHIANPNVSVKTTLRAVGLKKPPHELVQFFNKDGLLDDARTALNLLANVDNADPDSWGSFMEFCRHHYS